MLKFVIGWPLAFAIGTLGIMWESYFVHLVLWMAQ